MSRPGGQGGADAQSAQRKAVKPVKAVKAVKPSLRTAFAAFTGFRRGPGALIPLCESVAGLPEQIGDHVSSLFGREQ